MIDEQGREIKPGDVVRYFYEGRYTWRATVLEINPSSVTIRYHSPVPGEVYNIDPEEYAGEVTVLDVHICNSFLVIDPVEGDSFVELWQ